MTGKVRAVSKFEFGWGNLGKILALPLYGLGAIATALIPRRRDHWVFGSGVGIGEGALPLWAYARQSDPSRRYTWLVRNQTDADRAAELGIEAVRKNSWRGWWLTARAKVLVVTHGFGDVNRYATGGAFIVQLWHGIPYKRLHLDSPQVLRLPGLGSSVLARSLMTRAYRRVGKKISLFPVASDEVKPRIVSAFAMKDERVVVTGDPRDDVLLGGADEAERPREEARTKLAAILGQAIVLGSNVVLYAPTWRDGQVDPAVPKQGDWRAIAAVLAEHDLTLLIRSHPLGNGDYNVGAGLSDRIAVLDVTTLPDLTPMLPSVDCLVTDFSSTAYDFALLRRPMIFFAPDAAEYLARRGAYEPWSALTGGVKVTDWEGVAQSLARLATDPSYRNERVAHSAALAHRFHHFQDGNNTRRVYEAIVSRQT